MARTTAPEGFESNFSALQELLKFGYGIWTLTQMAVLLYHAERSTAVGKDADQHSRKDATDGIYSVRDLRWIRGPSGVSESTWIRSNRELRAAGVLKQIQRWKYSGKEDAPEYQIDWKSVAAVINDWKEGTRGSGCQADTQANTLGGGCQADTQANIFWGGCQADTHKLAETLPGCQADTPKLAETLPGCQADTHPLTDLTDSTDSLLRPSFLAIEDSDGRTDLDAGLLKVRPSGSPSVREAQQISAAAIAAKIEAATGERPRTDGLISKIINVAQKYSLPEEALNRWIGDKSHDLRVRGVMLSAGLLGKAVVDDIGPWVNANRGFIAQCQHRVELEQQRKAEVTEMPKPASQPASQPVEPAPDPDERLKALPPPPEPLPEPLIISGDSAKSPAPPVSPLEALQQAEDDRAFEVVTKKRRAAKAETSAPPSNPPEKPEVPAAAAPAVDHHEHPGYDEREASRRATEAAVRAARKAEIEQRRLQMQQVMRGVG